MIAQGTILLQSTPDGRQLDPLWAYASEGEASEGWVCAGFMFTVFVNDLQTLR
jgi:hypothetical protein